MIVAMNKKYVPTYLFLLLALSCLISFYQIEQDLSNIDSRIKELIADEALKQQLSNQVMLGEQTLSNSEFRLWMICAFLVFFWGREKISNKH